MSKKLGLVSAVLLLFLGVTNVLAATFDEVILLNDTKGDAWSLSGDVAKFDSTLSGEIATVDLLGNTTILNIKGKEGWGNLPVNPDPSAANGQIVKFTYGDEVLSLRIPSLNTPEGYDGIIKMPVTYNYQVTKEGVNPVIAWTNDFNTAYPNYAPIDQYRIRVYDENWSNMLVNHKIRSNEVDLTAAEQTFDFSTIDFSFEAGKQYHIRVEAREYTDLYDENNKKITANEFSQYIGIVNRNKADLDYPVSNLLTQTQASQLYVSIFGRASEGGGNAYWCSNQDDMTIAANTMLDTEPAKSYFGSTLNDNQKFIEFIYENTLGKTYTEDPDGVNYWVSELTNGNSKGQVIATLINAVMDSQYTGLPAQNRFMNKVDVSNYTANIIESAPDANDLSAFVQFISAVTDDPSTVTTAKADVDSKGPFKYTAEWLDGRSLYNVYFESDTSLWTISAFSYAGGNGSGYQLTKPDEIRSFTYTVSPDGILMMSGIDEGKVSYIKVVSQTDDYQYVCWTDLEYIMSCKGSEYFYFDLQKAQDFVNQKNAETTSAK